MLASPIIEGTLPAFYVNENGTAIITVPFFMSRAVSSSEIKGFRLKIKNVQGSDYLLSVDSSEVDFNELTVTFEIPQSALEYFYVGSFYKAQIAYIDLQGTTGYYSPVGIIKFTTKPTVQILNLKETWNNAHIYNYTGVYSQYRRDATEKVYSYRFVIRDSYDKVVKDTGFIIHNNSEDEVYYESRDNFSFTHELEENQKYTITYTVRTNNNLEISTAPYKIMAKKSVNSDLKADLIVDLNYNNGYVNIKLVGEKDDNGFEKPVRGSFVLTRASQESGYQDWEKIAEFSLASQKPSLKNWKDFAVEQGVSYKYSIQQYNKEGLYSERIISNIVKVDFEDSFLYDGTRQLKIKFNPKVTSFKKDLLEAKVDTLGSKYPFIFKNGNVEYKEFPISGLISYMMDDENLFTVDTKSLFYNQERHEDHRFTIGKNPFAAISVNTKPENEQTAQKLFNEEYLKKNNYLFYYIFNSEENKYERWFNYAERQPERKIRVTINGVVYIRTVKLDPADWESVYTYYREKGSKNEQPPKAPGAVYFEQRTRTDNINFGNTELATTNELSYNIFYERQFKLEVLDWLTNGKPKLFKSPNEGNYIVRLMNVSLSPNDQLGRMLHTFSATAYEVADMTYDSLVRYNIIGIEAINNNYLKVMTIPLATRDTNFVNLNKEVINYVYDEATGYYYATGSLLKAGINPEHLIFNDVEPGTQILIDNNSIVIGSTGTYEVPIKVSSVSLPSPQKSHGLLTVSYISEFNDSFNLITKTEIREVIGQQFIGRVEDVLNEIENIETNIVTFYDIKLNKRPMRSVYYLEEYLEVDPERISYNNYKTFYILQDGEYVTPTRYSIYETYYEKAFSLYEDESCEVRYATYRIRANNRPSLASATGRMDKLATYMYYRDQEESLNLPLYRKITFSDIGHQDLHGIEDNIRDWNNRSATNPYLRDNRDFDLMAYTGQLYQVSKPENDIIFTQVAEDAVFNPDGIYFIKEPIPFIFDPQKPGDYFIDHATYSAFEDLWFWIKQELSLDILPLEETFKRYFDRFTYYAYINSEPINLNETEVLQTGPIGKINSLELSDGLSCELYYQAQDIYYNIDQQYSLKEAKRWLTEARYKLTKDYMVDRCITNNAEDDYINEIKNIYENYHRNYAAYIASLTAYINSLEEEG